MPGRKDLYACGSRKCPELKAGAGHRSVCPLLGMDVEEVTFTHHRLETFAESEDTEGKMILVPLDALGTEIV